MQNWYFCLNISNVQVKSCQTQLLYALKLPYLFINELGTSLSLYFDKAKTEPVPKNIEYVCLRHSTSNIHIYVVLSLEFRPRKHTAGINHIPGDIQDACPLQ